VCFACDAPPVDESSVGLTSTHVVSTQAPIRFTQTPEQTAVISTTATVITLPDPSSTKEPLLIVPTPTESNHHLMVREPTTEQLTTYLLGYIEGPERYLDHVGEAFELYYEDVNNDGNRDLIVSDYLLVAILLWTGSDYQEPFLIQEDQWKLTPSSHVYLEDWTNDNVPEIVFEYLGDTGGTGVQINYWKRYIIHCDGTICNTVWQGDTKEISNNYNSGGVAIKQLAMELVIENNIPTLHTTAEAFGVYTFGFNFPPLKGYNLQALNILTSTLKTYQWIDSTFKPVNEQIIQLPQFIPSQSILSTINTMGQEATIAVTKFNAATNQNDLCELKLDSHVVSEPFGCKDNFTTLEWKDITNDGIDELIILALSGTYDPEGHSWGNKDCVHQHLLAYQWDKDHLDEIANVTGCVVQSDLYGVRLADIDNDGYLEILAADQELEPFCPPNVQEKFLIFACWREFVISMEIYRWEGHKFIWVETVKPVVND
jgi:hypothetical protein